jgi:hypothetical protein
VNPDEDLLEQVLGRLQIFDAARDEREQAAL